MYRREEGMEVTSGLSVDDESVLVLIIAARPAASAFLSFIFLLKDNIGCCNNNK